MGAVVMDADKKIHELGLEQVGFDLTFCCLT